MNRNLISRVLQISLIMIILVSALIVAVRYQTVTVPVLNTPVKAGDIVQNSQVSYVQLPAGAVFPGLILTGAQAAGQQASVNLAANQPLKTDEFVPAGTKRAPKLDPDFPYATSEDMPKIRYALQTDLINGDGGLLSVDDYVNIQHRWQPKNSPISALFILQRVHIIGAADKNGFNLSFVPNSPADKPKTSAVYWWYVALTQSQADELAQIDWKETYLWKTDLTKPLLTYGGQTVEVASIGTVVGGSANPTPAPVQTPSASETPGLVPTGNPVPSLSTLGPLPIGNSPKPSVPAASSTP